LQFFDTTRTSTLGMLSNVEQINPNYQMLRLLIFLKSENFASILLMSCRVSDIERELDPYIDSSRVNFGNHLEPRTSSIAKISVDISPGIISEQHAKEILYSPQNYLKILNSRSSHLVYTLDDGTLNIFE
jgi:hypothetical protein